MFSPAEALDMQVDAERIPDDLFAQFLDRMPQVSVELVLEHEGRVLLLERCNEPAKGEWFWPGTRLYKGEEFERAVRRLAREELGLAVDIERRLGVYSHFWEVGAFPGVETTHTVNVVYLAHPRGDAGEFSLTLDEQHGDVRWIDAVDDGLHEYVVRYLEDDSEIFG